MSSFAIPRVCDSPRDCDIPEDRDTFLGYRDPRGCIGISRSVANTGYRERWHIAMSKKGPESRLVPTWLDSQDWTVVYSALLWQKEASDISCKRAKCLSFPLMEYPDVLPNISLSRMSVYAYNLAWNSLNKKEWICSLFKEWILEKSEIRVNLEWTFVIHSFWSDVRDHSGIPSDPWGHSKMSE